MPIFKLSKRERRRVRVFTACVFTAVAAWFFYALSASYKFSVKARIQYKNVPTFKAVHPLQQGVVTAEMEAAGWHLLFSKFKTRAYSIPIDLREVDKKNFVTFSGQLNRINRAKGRIKVLSVSPDTLFFDFSKSTVKKVPLRFLYNLAFEKQYGINGKIMLKPDYVLLTGPAEELKKITDWPTDSLILKRVKKDIITVVNIKPSDMVNINVSPSAATVTVPVAEFTETTLEVPLKVFNNHEYEVKLLPEKVKITCLVSLKDFNSIDKNSFIAGVDFNQWLLQRYPRFPVMLKKIPPYVKVIKYEPQTVNFLIKE